MQTIVRLDIENIKRIEAFHLDPKDCKTVLIGGKNGQGKSSVLDSIMYAIGGKGKMPDRPVRNGAGTGSVRVETEELIIERKVRTVAVSLEEGGTRMEYETTLEVRNKDGSKVPSPQSKLNEYLEQISFDPTVFIKMKPKEQAEELQRVIGLDLSEIEQKRQDLYDRRTDVGRDAKRYEAQASEFEFDMDAPTEPIDTEDLHKQWREALAKETRYRDLCSQEERLRDRAERLRRELAEVEEQIEATNLEKQKVKEDHDTDPSVYQEKIKEAEEHNDKYNKSLQYTKLNQLAQDERNKYEQMSNEIDELDALKLRRIAEAEYPVEGLRISEEGELEYNGSPFSQCCTAEQLKVATAIAFEGNSELRIVLLREGAMLDDDSLRDLSDLAEKYNFQLWIERVGDRDDNAVIIQEGNIIRNLTPEQRRQAGESLIESVKERFEQPE